MLSFQGNVWSGREDSNLRPLPPEDATPDCTRRFSVVRRRHLVAFRGACSRLIHGFRGGEVQTELSTPVSALRRGIEMAGGL